MFYIYSKSVISGREEFVDIKETFKEAVQKVRQCYEIDSHCAQKDSYYYFIKQRG